MNINTIILKKGEARLTAKEWRNFEKGDTIWGEDSSPEDLKKWNIDSKEEAEETLKTLRCKYERPKGDFLATVEEYALEYCEYNEDDEFQEGSNYDLAETVCVSIGEVYDNVNEMVGEEYEYDDIIAAFEDYEYDGESEVIVERKINSNEYHAYVNARYSPVIIFVTDENNVISDVYLKNTRCFC